MNVWDVLLAAALAGAVTLAVLKFIRDRKHGKRALGCGGDCSHCAAACGRKKEEGKT